MTPSHTIFISYARPDRDRVLPFFEQLENDGFDPWIDCRRIKPGQNWDFEIQRAFEKASFILAFISNNSAERRGYVQRELKLALDKLTERLEDDIYIIPVLLDDDVEIPARLHGIQAIKLSERDCYQQIKDAIQHQLERLGAERREIQKEKKLSWTSSIKSESWSGLPGYEVEVEMLKFRSSEYPNVSDIGDFISGQILRGLFEHRSAKLDQAPELFNYGQDSFRRTNTYDAHCGEPLVVGKVVSVSYAVHWYGAGAAHPNHHFLTFNFLLDPLILIESPEMIFKESEQALQTIQNLVRSQLLQGKSYVDEGGSVEIYSLDAEWITAGTTSWEHFSSFVFKNESIEFLFAPYQVASYADGAQFAEVKYEEIFSLMKEPFISALELEHLKWSRQDS